MKIFNTATLLALFALALAGCSKSGSESENATDSETISGEETQHALYTNLSEETFAAFNADSDITVVDFWATWCGPCRTMAPRFESAATELKGIASFGKVDVDHNAQIARTYQIRAIPTILIFKDGELADTIVGVVSKDQIVAQVKKLI